jgi:hypothetical protein
MKLKTLQYFSTVYGFWERKRGRESSRSILIFVPLKNSILQHYTFLLGFSYFLVLIACVCVRVLLTRVSISSGYVERKKKTWFKLKKRTTCELWKNKKGRPGEDGSVKVREAGVVGGDTESFRWTHK